MFPRVACRVGGVLRFRRFGADTSAMVYWVHIARSNDRATLHRDRCSEVPSTHVYKDFWEGGWFDYPDKERALAALEQSGTTYQKNCPLCKP
jgi:hypothetical protein